jgi:hypothetical protein
MKDGGTDCQCISRRVVLTSTVLAFGAAATTTAISQAKAQQKISQEDAKYQGTPKGQQQCDGCINFRGNCGHRATRTPNESVAN